MQSAAVPPPRPAGFWIRAAAALIDFALFTVVQFVFGFTAARLWGAEVEESWAFQTAVVLFTLLFTAIYTTVLHAAGGQTIGKVLFGIRVLAADGSDLGVGPAFLRYLGYFASLLPLGTGFVMAGLRRDRRALHDLIAGSRVERRPARARLRPAAPQGSLAEDHPDLPGLV